MLFQSHFIDPFNPTDRGKRHIAAVAQQEEAAKAKKGKTTIYMTSKNP